ncbi:MAG TPA: TorF family putative porin [Sphingomonas sp.]
MRFSHISLGALALAIATPAMADPLPATTPAPDAAAAPTANSAADAPAVATADDPAPAPAAPAADGPTAPPPAFTINGSATLVSDYRFRGISQTNLQPAIQGSITLTHSSGFYASVWSSSTSGYVTFSGTGSQEIDLIAGFKKTYSGVTFDAGVLYYVYPRSRPAGDNSKADFFEPYADISYTYGPVTGKVTVNYAPKQKALSLDQGQTGLFKNNDNVYLAGDLSASIPKTPLGLTAHLGHTWGPSWLALGKEYTDWGLGATLTYKQLVLGVSYVDTDGVFTLPNGNNAARSGVVVSLGVSF